jgi:hypothetical protein
MTLFVDPGGVAINVIPIDGFIGPSNQGTLMPALFYATTFLTPIITGINDAGLSEIFCVGPVPDSFQVEPVPDSFQVLAGGASC